MTAELDDAPLLRIVAVRMMVEGRARQLRYTNARAYGQLRFRPDVLERVAAEAPVLLRHDMLKKVQIRLPEQKAHQHEWELDCEISYDWMDSRGFIWFGEAIPWVAHGDLDVLLLDGTEDPRSFLDGVHIGVNSRWFLNGLGSC